MAGRVQLTTDGYGGYLTAVREAFGYKIDYAQLVKDCETDLPRIYKTRYIGNPDPSLGSTRMRMRRVARKTTGYSRKV